MVEASAIRVNAVQRAQDYWKRELVGYDTSGNFLSRVPSASDYSEFDLQVLALLEAVASDAQTTASAMGIDGWEISLAQPHGFIEASGVAFMYNRKLSLLKEHMTDEGDVADDEAFWSALCDTVASVSLGDRVPVEVNGL